MISDRHYMREPSYGSRMAFSATIVLIIVNLVVFIATEINKAHGNLSTQLWEYEYLPLSTEGLRSGYFWQLLTFQFLHGSRWHFVFNMLGLFMFGRTVEEMVGKRHFLKIYFASGFLGGILQMILGFIFPDTFGLPVVGASAGVFGLAAAFARLEPAREILVFFVLPVRASICLWVATAVAIFYILVPAERGIAHGAHLGGIIAGVAYIRWVIHSSTSLVLWRPFRRQPQRRELVSAPPMKRSPWKRPVKTIEEELPPGEFISKEVDPILDKISAHGIQSLTDREKQILEAARKKMAKR
jgi:membrane associated rhomboid family serine protease